MGAVYRYKNINTSKFEYIGLVKDRPLYERILEHAKMEGWKNDKYAVDYIECSTRTDVEYLEANFIAKYNTKDFYNIKKTNMGKSNFINEDAIEWKPLSWMIVKGNTPATTAKEIASEYLTAPDKEKLDYYKELKEAAYDCSNIENAKYFKKVLELFPDAVKKEIFGTENKIINLELRSGIPIVSIDYLVPYTEAWYLHDADEFELKGVCCKGKVTRQQYMDNVGNILEGFAKIRSVFCQ